MSCGPLEIGLEVSVGAEVTRNSGSNSDLLTYLFIFIGHIIVTLLVRLLTAIFPQRDLQHL